MSQLLKKYTITSEYQLSIYVPHIAMFQRSGLELKTVNNAITSLFTCICNIIIVIPKCLH